MAVQYYKQNRLKQLQAFCFAARTGSISGAAGQLQLSQPAATLLVQALEKHLDSQLFTRRGPRIQLTAAGEILLQLALPLLEGFDDLTAVFHERCNQTLSGNLVIAGGESVTLYLLPEIVKQFTTLYPHIRLQLIHAAAGQVVELIRTGAADLAIGPLAEQPGEVSYLPVTRIEPVLITPSDHPLGLMQRISLEEICAYHLIMPPLNSPLRQVIDLVFQQKDLKYKVLMEAASSEVSKKYVETGLGIAIVTSICLTGKEKISRISLRDFFPASSYGIIVRHDKYLSPAARHFMELVGVTIADA